MFEDFSFRPVTGGVVLSRNPTIEFPFEQGRQSSEALEVTRKPARRMDCGGEQIYEEGDTPGGPPLFDRDRCRLRRRCLFPALQTFFTQELSRRSALGAHKLDFILGK